MFRSIRWTLLVWQALILVAVVATFAAVLYAERERSLVREAEADLLGVAEVLAAIPGTSANLAIPADYRRRFGKNPQDAPYFSVWQTDGTLLATSLEVAPQIVPRIPKDKPHPWTAHEKDGTCEVVLLDRGRIVLVGRSLAKDREKLVPFVWQLVGTACGVTLLGLAGSWWLASRVLAPIDRMTKTAEAISTVEPAARIDVAETKSELGRLAGVLNRAFDSLQGLVERQRAFTADASHELRTPLAVIESQLDLTLARERTPEEYREALAVCSRAADRMRLLVEDLLMLAQADAGQLIRSRNTVDLRETVEASVSLVATLADSRQIAVNCDLAPVACLGDADRLEQAVEILLANAVRYNRDAGRIEVRLVGSHEEVELSVTDTGPGIPPEAQDTIFDRFTRLDCNRSRDGGGSGLGLAICKEIVAAHGGRIEVESQPGEGSTFTIRLPASVAQAATAPNVVEA
jgi:heavy metal sensor kinase